MINYVFEMIWLEDDDGCSLDLLFYDLSRRFLFKSL